MGNSVMRPETISARHNEPCLDDFDAYFMIRDAVERKGRLIKGKLHDSFGDSCAIGAFWDDNPKLSLHTSIIDEVARYNDSVRGTEHQRRDKVLAWLNAKIAYLTGKRKTAPKATAPVPKAPQLTVHNGGKVA
jgi:hypothetical protein